MKNSLSQTTGTGGSQSAFTVNYDVRKFIREGYSKEILLDKYRALGKKIGRTPQVSDLDEASKRGETPSGATYLTVFGRISFAQISAKVTPTRFRLIGKDALLEQYKNLAQKLGRMPKAPDLKIASRNRETASIPAFKNAFGSLLKLQEAAGFKPSRVMSTKDELMREYEKMKKSLGKNPRIKDIRRAAMEDMGLPCYNTFAKKIGDKIREEKRADGEERWRKYSNKELLDQYVTLAKLTDRALTNRAIGKGSQNGLCASYATFSAQFGGMKGILRAVKNYRLSLSQDKSRARENGGVLSEDRKCILRSKLHVHGINSWMDIQSIGLKDFARLDFGSYGKGPTFLGYALGKPGIGIHIEKEVLEEMAIAIGLPIGKKAPQN